MKNVYILGGGSFGTAFGNQLASNNNNKVVLFVRSEIQEKEINESQSNKKYFPNKEEAFMDGIQAGSTYKVGGWINESTTVRF